MARGRTARRRPSRASRACPQPAAAVPFLLPRSPMPLSDHLLGLQAEIRVAAAAHGARDVRIFGSVARGEERPESDVDVLVDLDPGRTLFDVAALEERLESLLGRRVQVATARELRDPVRRAAERAAPGRVTATPPLAQRARSAHYGAAVPALRARCRRTLRLPSGGQRRPRLLRAIPPSLEPDTAA